MESILNFIKTEWATLKGASLTFCGLLVLGVAGGYAGGAHLKAQEIANLKSLIRLKDGELDEFRKQIDERLKDVEQKLSQQQLSSFEDYLRAAQPQTVTVETAGGNKEAGDLSSDHPLLMRDRACTEPYNALPPYDGATACRISPCRTQVVSSTC